MEHALDPWFFNVQKWTRAYDQLINNLEGTPIGYIKSVFSDTFPTDSWKNGMECAHLHTAILNGAFRAYDVLHTVSESEKFGIESRVGQAIAWAAILPHVLNFEFIDPNQMNDIPYYSVSQKIARYDNVDDQWKLWELATRGLKTIQGDADGSKSSEQLLADIWTMDTVKPEDWELKTLAIHLIYTELHPVESIDFSHTVGSYIQRIKEYFPHSSDGILALQRVMDQLVTMAYPESLQYVVEILEYDNPVIRQNAEMLLGRFVRGCPEEVGALFQKFLKNDDPHQQHLAKDIMLPLISRGSLH